VTRSANPGDPLWSWPNSFFPEFLRQLVGDSYLSPEAADAFLQCFLDSESHPDGTFLAPPMLSVVARKPA
jgi:hypothetical protein